MAEEKHLITTILFDFDGTIANTFNELVKIYNEIASSMHCKPVEEKDIPRLRNKRPQDFMSDYNVSTINLPRLILKGRKALKKKIHEIQPFDNLTNVLLELKACNYQLGILSSNSQKNIRRFLFNNNIEHLFNFIYNGKNLFGKSKKIYKIFKEQNLKNHQVLMIGDETRDVEAAHKTNIAIVAVSWGFCGREVLQKLNPSFIADHPNDILSYVKQLSEC